MSDPAIVKTITEDPGLLQRVLLWAFGIIGSLSAMVLGLVVKANRRDITGLHDHIVSVDTKAQLTDARVDNLERDLRSNFAPAEWVLRVEDKIAKLNEKTDSNHRDVMQVLLDGRRPRRTD